ncbi:MAG: YajG family lipoprotein [Saccharospirillum sp.]|nr:YajG family lipoprotein [Saccharospirillum sp.]
MSNAIVKLCWVALAAMLAGCAQFSPQQVEFTPSIEQTSVPQGNGAGILVNVTDRRSSTVIGYRGGTYAESSSITASNDLRRLIENIAEDVLTRGGYRLDGSMVDMQMTIYLDELSYQLEDLDAVRKRATGAARVSVEVFRDRSNYSNSYRAQRSIETFRYPSEERNDELLNRVLETALNRMFSDAGLENFMNAF